MFYSLNNTKVSSWSPQIKVEEVDPTQPRVKQLTLHHGGLSLSRYHRLKIRQKAVHGGKN